MLQGQQAHYQCVLDFSGDESLFFSFFLGFRKPNLITGLSGGEHPISHLGPKNLSQTGGPEHYLVYGRPNQIPNLVGKTDHNVGGLQLACILRVFLFLHSF